MTVYLTTAYERATSAWEHSVVDAHDRKHVSVPTATAVAQHAWTLLGLDRYKRPPAVALVPQDSPDYVSGACASMSLDGLNLNLYGPCNTATILHEIAHATVDCPLEYMDTKRVVERAYHGKLWLGNYLWLLDRLMGPKYNTFRLRSTMPAIMRPQALLYHPVVWGVPQPQL